MVRKMSTYDLSDISNSTDASSNTLPFPATVTQILLIFGPIASLFACLIPMVTCCVKYNGAMMSCITTVRDKLVELSDYIPANPLAPTPQVKAPENSIISTKPESVVLNEAIISTAQEYQLEETTSVIVNASEVEEGDEREQREGIAIITSGENPLEHNA
jgi:hypothetical protein